MDIKREYLLTTLFAFFLLAGILVGYVIANQQQLKAVNPLGEALGLGSEEGLKTIVVTGEGVVSAEPDLAEVSLGVQTYAESADKALKLNSERMNRVIENLKALGLSEDDFKTGSLTLSPQYSKEEPHKVIGYRATNTIIIRLTDLSIAGKVSDGAVNAGANRGLGVQFKLSEEKAAEVKVKALKLAALDAKAKAESIASALDVEIIGVYKVSESYMPVYPVRGFEAAGLKAETPVFPGEVQGRASVQVEFLIK
ncbi:SIMPL domain-containing protein [Candidatus Bathyarchaeota archaeon]|nr:MAG: SIMPL domain-containing protein [Candidatus Bathyarchaeota archaeon]